MGFGMLDVVEKDERGEGEGQDGERGDRAKQGATT